MECLYRGSLCSQDFWRGSQLKSKCLRKSTLKKNYQVTKRMMMKRLKESVCQRMLKKTRKLRESQEGARE